MAREEIPEAGETDEKAEAQNSVETLSQRRVFVCEACGKGFLTWIPGGIDTDPIWYWLGAGIGGYQCGGPLRMVTRKKAIELAEGKQWRREK